MRSLTLNLFQAAIALSVMSFGQVALSSTDQSCRQHLELALCLVKGKEPINFRDTRKCQDHPAKAKVLEEFLKISQSLPPSFSKILCQIPRINIELEVDRLSGYIGNSEEIAALPSPLLSSQPTFSGYKTIGISYLRHFERKISASDLFTGHSQTILTGDISYYNAPSEDLPIRFELSEIPGLNTGLVYTVVHEIAHLIDGILNINDSEAIEAYTTTDKGIKVRDYLGDSYIFHGDFHPFSWLSESTSPVLGRLKYPINFCGDDCPSCEEDFEENISAWMNSDLVSFYAAKMNPKEDFAETLAFDVLVNHYGLEYKMIYHGQAYDLTDVKLGPSEIPKINFVRAALEELETKLNE